MSTLHPFLRGFVAAMRPPDRSTPWQWCEKHLVVDETSSMPGRWRSSNSPWVRVVMETAQDREVKKTVVKCSAQSAKTQTIMGIACWIITESPAPAMYVMAAQDEAKDFLRDRMLPTFQKCKPVRDRLISVDKLTAVFSSCPFYFTGAGSKSKLQGKPIRYLFLDEIRNYPEGRIEQALKRVRSFWNHKIFMISTPSMVGDDVDLAYKSGSQETWHTLCPKCGGVEKLVFERLKWDTNETTKPDGTWNFDRLAETIRLNCASCDYVWRDNPVERFQIAQCGKFVSLNPGAPKHTRSFHWNALLPMWVPWRSIIEEFINGRKALKNAEPDFEPFKAFVCETLGESWEEALGVLDDYGFLNERMGSYGFDDVWPEEKVRFMSVDKQERGGEHYWWLIRAFANSGKSRLISYGRSNTLQEVEEIRLKYKVKLSNIMIDSGFKASDVYRWCLKMGWKPFKGVDTDFFTVQVNKSKPVTAHRIWRKTSADVSFGLRSEQRHSLGRKPIITLYQWATSTTKDLLAEFMRGLIGDWTIPAVTGSDYIKQISADQRLAKEDAHGKTTYFWKQVKRDNHLKDCEEMVLVAAVASGVIRSSGITRVGAADSKLSKQTKEDGK